MTCSDPIDATKIFGLPPEAELRYEDFLERVHTEDRQRVDAIVQAVLDPDGTGDYELEYRIVRPSHEVRWVAAKGKVFFKEETEGRVPYRFMGTLIDCTEHKQIQQALVESEKLAMTGRLAASIAHEIRNPLESISNLLFLLKDEVSEKLREDYVHLAMEELRRATAIASDTLHFYRVPAAVGEAYDPAEVIQSVLSLFQSRIRACHIKLHTSIARGVLLRMPEGELRQILVNLIGNALDALAPGGKLYIGARPLSEAANGRRVMLTVADTGLGMSPEVRARLFEAFYTTKGAKGNGIGLWLSLEILKKYGSGIRVKSTPTRGTAVCLFLI